MREGVGFSDGPSIEESLDDVIEELPLFFFFLFFFFFFFFFFFSFLILFLRFLLKMLSPLFFFSFRNSLRAVTVSSSYSSSWSTSWRNDSRAISGARSPPPGSINSRVRSTIPSPHAPSIASSSLAVAAPATRQHHGSRGASRTDATRRRRKEEALSPPKPPRAAVNLRGNRSSRRPSLTWSGGFTLDSSFHFSFSFRPIIFPLSLSGPPSFSWTCRFDSIRPGPVRSDPVR